MTVPADYQPDVSTGNGVTTSFPYTFRILNAADLLVQVDGVTATGYTVDGVGEATGGNVTFAAAPADGATIVRARDMGYSRIGTDYQEGGGFKAATVNDDFDRAIMLLQQLHDLARRSIALPLDSAIRDLVIPSPEAGKVLLWNADADALQNGPTADEITSAQTYANDASASASESSTSAAAASGSASDAADSAAAAATSLIAAGLPNPIVALAFLQANADGTAYDAKTPQQVADDVQPLLALTFTDLAAAFGGSNQSLAASGHQKLPGGLIAQWGTSTLPANTTGNTITFPVAFPNACLAIAVSGESGTGTTPLQAKNKSKTGFTFAQTGSASGSQVACYIAVGY